jgi:predicted Zn-dependent protease with MMP-like domain
MDHSEFESVVLDVVQQLPDWVHDALDNIDLLVEDEAAPGIEPDGECLLGLYVGTPLPERDANHAGELPDVIYIYRLAHLDMGLSDDDLRDEIATTIVHEIAHYFGIDDEKLHELGWG